MQISLLLAFAGLALTLIVVPGPDWAFVLASGIHHHVVLPAVAGLMGGYLVLTAIIAAGVGPIVASAPWFLLVLTVVGAAYLVYLGVGILHRPSAVPLAGGPVLSRRSYVVKGMGVSALNPKGLLLFVAILPQFARADATWPVAVQLVVLGVVFIALCGTFYLVLGAVADRVLGSRPRTARMISRIAGAAMIVIGLALIGEQIAEIVARGGLAVA
ncbi:LysE family translocator [Microbacterium sp. KR10-403]|uniref:LysE family translocator n=1 Tax=Microbacterium sp. KR10-403 TaxID=3158581 RepID=UPI0032E446C8